MRCHARIRANKATAGDSMSAHRRQFVLGALGAGVLPLVGMPSIARAASYPERPITFICPWPAGGTADVTMRAVCALASRQLGQTLVLENRTGGSGMIGLKAMAGA